MDWECQPFLKLTPQSDKSLPTQQGEVPQQTPQRLGMSNTLEDP